MHVIVVTDVAHVDGGSARIALGSAIGLAQRDVRVTVFSAVGPVAPNLAGIQVVCLHQHEILNDPSRLRAITQGVWNSTAAARMTALLRTLDRNDTIVHLHTWTKALSASVVAAALALGFRVVLSLHDYFAACPAGSFFLSPQQQICTLRPMSLACIKTNCDSRNYANKLWRVGRQFVANQFAHMPSGILDYISVSDLSEAVLRPCLPANARIRRVQNFIDVQTQPPVHVAANTTFSYVGRLSAEKGPLLFAQAAHDLPIDIQFLGDGPLRAQIAQAAPRATLSGWLTPAHVASHLQRSRALVFPSLWYETQGLVVAECAAMGIPAIVPSTCAAREWVQHGITGLHFRGGDAGDLREKILQLHNDPQLAATMGLEAHRRYAQQPATLAMHCDHLLAVYRDMLAQPTG